jgi:hypothetical protein
MQVGHCPGRVGQNARTLEKLTGGAIVSPVLVASNFTMHVENSVGGNTALYRTTRRLHMYSAATHASFILQHGVSYLDNSYIIGFSDIDTTTTLVRVRTYVRSYWSGFTGFVCAWTGGKQVGSERESSGEYGSAQFVAWHARIIYLAPPRNIFWGATGKMYRLESGPLGQYCPQ